jgi:hypothetical protein
MRTTLKNIKIDTLHIFVVFFACWKGEKFCERKKSGKFSNTAENTFSSSSASRRFRPGIRCYRCVHILGRLRVKRRIFTSSLAPPSTAATAASSASLASRLEKVENAELRGEQQVPK